MLAVWVAITSVAVIEKIRLAINKALTFFILFIQITKI